MAGSALAASAGAGPLVNTDWPLRRPRTMATTPTTAKTATTRLTSPHSAIHHIIVDMSPIPFITFVSFALREVMAVRFITRTPPIGLPPSVLTSLNRDDLCQRRGARLCCLAEAAQQMVACLLTAAARLGADAAVVVHASVALALVTAGLAGRDASLKDSFGEVRLVPGVPGQHRAGGRSDVEAVEVGADAPGQLGYRLLAQAGVGAGGAHLSALEPGSMHAASACLSMTPRSAGVAAQHGSRLGHGTRETISDGDPRHSLCTLARQRTITEDLQIRIELRGLRSFAPLLTPARAVPDFRLRRRSATRRRAG